MKTISISIISLFIIANAVIGAPLETLKQECQEPLVSLAKSYLEKHSVLLSIYEDSLGAKLDISNLSLCDTKDLDQGSSSVRRENAFCDKEGVKLTLYTHGEHYCDAEEVLGIKSLDMHPVSNEKP